MGDLRGAIRLAEGGLARGGDIGALNALLGMLRGQVGDLAGAIRHLEAAHKARPDDVRIAGNYASALAADNRLDQALAVASAPLAFSDPTQQLARIRGFVAQNAGNTAAAIEAYEHVVKAAPDDWESWNNLGNAKGVAGDTEGGIQALQRAAALNPQSLLTRINLARLLRRAGNFAEAEALLRRTADAFPADAQSLTELHDVLKLQGREDEELIAVLDRALERDPANVELHLARARQLVMMLEMDAAEAAFRTALEHDPANAEAFVGLSIVYEHSRPAALPDLAEEAGRQQIEPGHLALIKAFACRRAGRHAEGIAELENNPSEFEAPRRAHLLGQMLDAGGDHDAAFAAFDRMNRAHAEDPSRPIERAAAARTSLRAQLETLGPQWLATWKTPALEAERPAPIFLVGFPRSGTTLLDTLLMGHPDVEVMEERPVVYRVEREFGGFEKMAELDADQLRQAQRRYFEIAGEYADVERGAVLVDKSPLLLNRVPTIHRLFPGARFILALRHPADVLFSCFSSNFRLNSAMANFLRLDTAAEYYDLAFSMWEKSCALLPVQVHRIVYERLVEDPETELRRLSDELGLSWRQEMLDHTKTAARRGVITTASYAQVTEPIYQRSVGRWHGYRKHLEPIFPILSPWAERFGYGPLTASDALDPDGSSRG